MHVVVWIPVLRSWPHPIVMSFWQSRVYIVLLSLSDLLAILQQHFLWAVLKYPLF